MPKGGLRPGWSDGECTPIFLDAHRLWPFFFSGWGGGKIKNFNILIFLFDFLGGRGGGGFTKFQTHQADTEVGLQSILHRS